MKKVVFLLFLALCLQAVLPTKSWASKKPTFKIKYFDLTNSEPPLQSDVLTDTLALQEAIVKNKCLEKQVSGFHKVRKDPEIQRILKFAKGSPVGIELVVTVGPEKNEKGSPIPKMSELAIWRDDAEQGFQLLNSDQIFGKRASCKMNKKRLKGLLIPVIQMERKRLQELKLASKVEKKKRDTLKLKEAGKLLSEINQ